MADPSGLTEAPVPSKDRLATAAKASPQSETPTGIWGRITEHKVAQWTLAYAAGRARLEEGRHGTGAFRPGRFA